MSQRRSAGSRGPIEGARDGLQSLWILSEVLFDTLNGFASFNAGCLGQNALVSQAAGLPRFLNLLTVPEFPLHLSPY